MRQRFRTVLWRELPFSARRALLNTARAVDRLEAWVEEAWNSLFYSPAWLFVAMIGTLGIVLTILLFFSLSRELLAGGRSIAAMSALPIIESAELPAVPREVLDSRLCLDTADRDDDSLVEFEFMEELSRIRRPVVRERRPPVRREPIAEAPEPIIVRQPPVIERERPVIEREPPVIEHEPQGKPDLNYLAEFWHQTRGRPQVPDRPQSLTARTVFPDEPRTRLRSQVRSDRDEWSLASGRGGALTPPTVPEAYAGLSQDPRRPIDVDESFWADVSAWPAKADAAFRVELHAPETATLQATGRSSLVIRNTGTDMLRRIEIQESARDWNRLAGAEPEAFLEGHVLRRELTRLRSDREKTVSLDWFAMEPGARRHEAMVVAEVFVGGATDVARAEVPKPEPEPVVEPEPPPMVEPRPRPRPRPEPLPLPEPEPLPEPVRREEPPAEPPPPEPEPQPAPIVETPPPTLKPSVSCVARGTPTVNVDGEAELTVEVRNNGEAVLHNVQLETKVPPALHHADGRLVQQRVGRLEPGESKEVVIRLTAARAGTALTTFTVSATEPVTAQAETRTTIVAPKPKPKVTSVVSRPPAAIPTGRRLQATSPPNVVSTARTSPLLRSIRLEASTATTGCPCPTTNDPTWTATSRLIQDY